MRDADLTDEIKQQMLPVKKRKAISQEKKEMERKSCIDNHGSSKKLPPTEHVALVDSAIDMAVEALLDEISLRIALEDDQDLQVDIQETSDMGMVATYEQEQVIMPDAVHSPMQQGAVAKETVVSMEGRTMMLSVKSSRKQCSKQQKVVASSPHISMDLL